MINNIKTELCSGCMACSNICPKDAINFKPNKKGFLYPIIDEKKCIKCSLCDKVCQTLQYSKHNHQLRAYAVVNNDDTQRSTSQSGGLFAALATVILSQGGNVYGAAFDDSLNVIQTKITKLEDLIKLQGSKYVQSEVRDTFNQVKEDLEDGKAVLYSGTSCMISGLLLYLSLKKTDINNLYTCDLICHGVNSPLIYQENLNFIEKRHKKTIRNFHFRHPKFGWRSSIEYYEFDDGSSTTSTHFPDLFYSDVMLRDSCYNCQYAEIENKVADITMADFWGIEKIYPDFFNDNQGISLAIVRSDKGLFLFEKANLTVKEVDPNLAVSCNVNKAATLPKHTNKFWKDYWNKGYEVALKKWSIYGGILFKVKRKIMRNLNKW